MNEKQKVKNELDLFTRQLCELTNLMIKNSQFYDAAEWETKDKIRKSLRRKIGYRKYLLKTKFN